MADFAAALAEVTRPVGAPGRASGVTMLVRGDTRPVPAVLIAATSNEYPAPMVSTVAVSCRVAADTVVVTCVVVLVPAN